MKIKKTYVALSMLILSAVLLLILLVTKINIVQFIAFTMVLSVLWGLLCANVFADITANSILSRVLKIIALILTGVTFAILLYGVLWHYLPMQTIENNTHFGPTESITFNSNINLGTYVANSIQQIVISVVFYYIIKFVRKLKK